MKAIFALLVLAAGLLRSNGQTMPYTPWRTINGTNYNLQPLYAWRTNILTKYAALPASVAAGWDKATRNAVAQHLKRRPHPNWIGGYPNERFTVEQVFRPDLMLVKWEGYPLRNATEIVVKNYPEPNTVTDGQSLEFFALEVGRYQYTNRVAGPLHTLPLYDYGSPCAAPSTR